MSNLHGIPDTMAEVMARDADLLSPGVLSSTITAPGGGMTLAAFATTGYVRAGSPTRLTYVAQPAHSVVLTGADGNYWLALHADTHTNVAGWSRQAGTHYLWRSAPTQPADPPGGLVMAGMTVAGSAITAISSANFNANQVAFGASPYGGLDFDPLFRYDPVTTSLVLGSLSVNPLLRLAVTGTSVFDGAVGIGTATPSHMLHVGGSSRFGDVGIGTTPQPGNALSVTGRSVYDGDVGIHTIPAYPLDVIGLARLGNTAINALPTAGIALGVVGHIQVSGGNVGLHVAPSNGIVQSVHYEKNTGVHGLLLAQRGSDTGSYAVLFTNTADAIVGSIATTGSDTAFNTTSDARLKDAIALLTGGLDVVRALRPVRFIWKADGEPGTGFLAHEVDAVVPGVVTGAADAVDDAGQIMPQQMDASRLVPWLVASMQEMAEQVQTLTARLAVLEEALGG